MNSKATGQEFQIGTGVSDSMRTCRPTGSFSKSVGGGFVGVEFASRISWLLVPFRPCQSAVELVPYLAL